MRGLSETVAEVILDSPEKYQYFFENIHQISPVVSSSLFSLARE